MRTAPSTTPETKKDQGFTLIELLVVVVIIGVLAAIAIPVFLNQREKAADSATKSDLRNAATTMETFYVDAQSYTDGDDAADAELDPYRPSSGVDVSIAKQTEASFCLLGENPAGSGDVYYDSELGGLVDGLPDGTGACDEVVAPVGG